MNIESQENCGSDPNVYSMQGNPGNEEDFTFHLGPLFTFSDDENYLMLEYDSSGETFDLRGQPEDSFVQNGNMQPSKTIESSESNSPSSFNSKTDVRSPSDVSNGINLPIPLNVLNNVGEQISSNEVRSTVQPMLGCRLQDLSVSRNQNNGQFYQFNAFIGANGQSGISSFIYGVYATMPFVSYDYKNDFQKFIKYLNFTINADEKKNINKKQLLLLHNLLMQHYNGLPKISRKEKRKRNLILWKLYQEKHLVQFSFEKYPEIFVTPVAFLKN